MIHVLHVVSRLALGGMELGMQRVISGLRGPHMRHSVACLTGQPEPDSLFDPAVEIHYLRSRPNAIALPLRLRRLIRRIRPTVIHARNWGAWPDMAVARLGTWRPIPLIFSFYGLDGPMPLRRKLAFRALARVTTCLFTVSEASRRMLVADAGWPERRVEVIPDGIDTHRFRPGRRRLRKRLVVGTAGSLKPLKNHPMLIRACADLSAGGTDVELRIAGEGPERPRLAQCAERLGFAGRLRLAGYVSDMPAFLRGLDVFALPSDFEQLPNALLEAMACGLPCVATRVGGAGEILDDGRCGLLVEPKDSGAMAGAIARLSRDQSLRRRLGKAACEQVCRKYSLERMLAAHEDLYRRLSMREFRRSRPGTRGCDGQPCENVGAIR